MLHAQRAEEPLVQILLVCLAGYGFDDESQQIVSRIAVLITGAGLKQKIVAEKVSHKPLPVIVPTPFILGRSFFPPVTVVYVARDPGRMLEKVIDRHAASRVRSVSRQVRSKWLVEIEVN